MKKGDTIQLIVIILACIIGFNGFKFFIDTAVNLLFIVSVEETRAHLLSPLIVTSIITLLQAILCWIVLIKSAKIANFMYEKTGIGTSFKIVSEPNDLLYLLLIAIGFYFIIDHLPVLIQGLLNVFRSKANSRFYAPEFADDINWTTTFIKLLLPAVLLMAARPIANYFTKNVQDEPIIIGENIDGLEDDETKNS